MVAVSTGCAIAVDNVFNFPSIFRPVFEDPTLSKGKEAIDMTAVTSLNYFPTIQLVPRILLCAVIFTERVIDTQAKAVS